MKKRSLAELDQVIEEMLNRNTDFLDKLEGILKNKDVPIKRIECNERT
jgi:hypothetical protein